MELYIRSMCIYPLLPINNVLPVIRGIMKLRNDIVQIAHPKTKFYTKINCANGAIQHKKSPGPYKNVTIIDSWEQMDLSILYIVLYI